MRDQIRFTDVGHLLGSASIEVWATEDGVTKKIVFSGDIGNLDQPIIKDPAYTESADYIVMESTYGNRLHTQEKPDYLGDFTRILKETFDKGECCYSFLCCGQNSGTPLFYT